MEEIVIGNEFFFRRFFRCGQILSNNAYDGEIPFKYEGLTDNPDGSSSLAFEGVRHAISGKTLYEGPHEVFSLDFSDRLKPLKLSWNFRFYNETAGYDEWIEIITDTFPLGDWRKCGRDDRLDVFSLNRDTDSLYLAAFRAGTDCHNEFINFSKHGIEKSEKENWLDGDILRVEKNDGSGLIIMKVSLAIHDRREKIRATFKTERGNLAVYGWGIEPHEFVLKEYLRMVVLFSKYRKNLHEGFVCPVGEEPGGSSFTGFMKRSDRNGLILIFREMAKNSKASIFLPGVEKGKVETVFTNTTVRAHIDNSHLNIMLEDRPSFALLSFCQKQ